MCNGECEIRGSTPDRIKAKNVILVFAIFLLASSIKEQEQTIGCVRVQRHVNLWTDECSVM